MVKVFIISTLLLILVLRPLHCLPLNVPARVPTEAPSYKDSLLSGKDFLSVFVRSNVAHSGAKDTSQVPPTPATRLPSETTEKSSGETLDEKKCKENEVCNQRVISVRVSSSVSETTPKKDSSVSTISPIRNIFTSFLDAFAERRATTPAYEVSGEPDIIVHLKPKYLTSPPPADGHPTEPFDRKSSYDEEGFELPVGEKVESSQESTSISLLEKNVEVSSAPNEKVTLKPEDSSSRYRLQYSSDRLRSNIDYGSSYENRYQSLQQSVLTEESGEEDDVPEEENSQEVSFSTRRQKSLFHHYLRHQFPRESGFGSPPFEQHFPDGETRYLTPEGPHREPEEMNYEVAEEVSVMSRGRVHGLQPTPSSLRVFDRDLDARKAAAANQKFGYVVEGRNYRKYRVEERTSDGFIVGEYGVVNHDDGVLRGVRYTADGTINPRLIYEALMKFLSL